LLFGRPLRGGISVQNEVFIQKRRTRDGHDIQRKALQFSSSRAMRKMTKNFLPNQARRAPKQENAVKSQEMQRDTKRE
jgi:hypothetical protein